MKPCGRQRAALQDKGFAVFLKALLFCEASLEAEGRHFDPLRHTVGRKRAPNNRLLVHPVAVTSSGTRTHDKLDTVLITKQNTITNTAEVAWDT